MTSRRPKEIPSVTSHSLRSTDGTDQSLVTTTLDSLERSLLLDNTKLKNNWKTCRSTASFMTDWMLRSYSTTSCIYISNDAFLRQQVFAKCQHHPGTCWTLDLFSLAIFIIHDSSGYRNWKQTLRCCWERVQIMMGMGLQPLHFWRAKVYIIYLFLNTKIVSSTNIYVYLKRLFLFNSLEILHDEKKVVPAI